MKNRTRTEKIITVVTWTVILLSWYLVTRFKLVSSTLFPSPMKVWDTFQSILQNGYNKISIWSHLGASFQRLFSAMGLAILTGVPLGLLSGYFSKVRAVIDSVVEFYRPLPPLAYYTLLVLWLGIDNESKIMLLFLAGFAPIYIACVSAVNNIKQDYLLSARSLGASQKQIFFKIVMPACLPEILIGVRTAMGFAYTTLVASEMVAATSGIGWMVLDASNFLKSDVIFVGILFMGATGILIDSGLKYIERKLVFWRGYI
ncbi:ABC transporter permease [Alkalibacter rhizosphaerae]|uniref:ABC transporter permease n=1 Tax=Alkalibacter rhizosphaerae TaxID=2815577 RepID=A0A974XGE1_9FIRM|nr:ABC transporter permease [Alkalibacter rhizosphaerae]QSX09387.1 ABC transporter permease [Alkalibacter rhizosphaerae]